MTGSVTHKRALMASAAMLCALLAAPLGAQTAPADTETAAPATADQSATPGTPPAQSPEPAAAADSAAASGDIVVTATRTSSLASKTPVALSAVSGQALRDANVTNVVNLGDRTPNLQIARNNGVQITIRGVSSSDNTEKGDPSAAFMQDGIYIARAQAFEVSFYDLDRVEVLRGPQGTLFGRNTTAGLINLIANKPALGIVEGSVDATYGNYDTVQATGVFNLPIGQSAAVRAAVNYDRRNTYTYGGPTFRSDLYPGKENLSGRVSGLVDLGGRGQLIVRADYSSIRGQPFGEVPTANFYTNFDVTGSTPIYIGNQRSNRQLQTTALNFSGPLGQRNNTWGVMGDLSYDLGPVTFNYLGSYREFHRREENVFLSTFIDPVSTYNRSDYWQNSQEVRLSVDEGPLKAQAGAYYFYEQSAVAFYLLNFPFSGKPVFGFPQDPVKSKSWAGFGQVTYSLLPSVRVTGGIRYSHDDKSRDGFIVGCQTFACNSAGDFRSVNEAARSWSRTTYKGGLEVDLDARSLLYGSYTTGYKAGGFNDGCLIGSLAGCDKVASQLYYDPEDLGAYEIGLKTRLADNTVRLNLSAFHYDYTNLQVSQTGTCLGAPCSVTQNAAAAKIDGAEFEGTLVPAPSMRFDLTATWLDARYDRFLPAPGVDWSGRPLDNSPRLVASAGYTHTLRLGNGGSLVGAIRTRVSDKYVITQAETLHQFPVPSYTRTDVVVTYNAPGQHFYVQGFANNLENNIIPTLAKDGLFAFAAFQDPRTYGVRGGIRF